LLDAHTGLCAGRPLSGEERTVGYHNDVNQTVGATSQRAPRTSRDSAGNQPVATALGSQLMADGSLRSTME